MATKIRIDADFPGGNIILDGVKGDEVTLHQDQRDTTAWWFYWYFRVRGAAGRRLRFNFVGHSPMTTLGPAVSRDGGRTWRWLGRAAMSGASFHYVFGPDERETRFCLAMPYLQADLQRFVSAHRGHPNLRAETLCTSRKGRPVEMLRLGCLDCPPDFRVLLTARHHCCEMMAGYTMEGVFATILGRSNLGRWLREHVEFLAVPFVDKDGVEEGDQGKLRGPHDHGRDYGHKPIYPETAAIKKLVSAWSEGRLRAVLDLHCPWVRGSFNEFVYFRGPPDQQAWEQIGVFSRILEQTRTGPLPFHAADNLPFGKAWNTVASNESSMAWGRSLPGVRLMGALEIPYSYARGRQVTARSARLLGRDLARAVMLYLQGLQGGL